MEHLPEEFSLDLEEQRALKLFDFFHLFFFSRTQEGKTCFLLRKNSKNLFIDFNGIVTDIVIFSLTKHILEKTGGILCTPNHPYFVENSDKSFDLSDISIDTGKNFWPMRSTPLMEDIFRAATNTPYRFQENESNCAYFFIELPMFDLNRVHQAIQLLKWPLEFRYYTLEDIMTNTHKEIDPLVWDLCKNNKKLISYINTFIIRQTPMVYTETYIFMRCTSNESKTWLDATHSSYFRKHGERWLTFYPSRNEYPTDEDLSTAKGIIIPGSSANIYQEREYPWIPKVLEFIKHVITDFPNLNLLGICFGAQAICAAMGGKVENMRKGYLRTGEVLRPSSDFYELPYVKSLGLDPEKPLSISEFHEDHISVVPDSVKVYARSKTANVELFGIGEHVLGWQGHPDYPQSFLRKGTYPQPLTQKETLSICEAFLKRN